MIGFAAERPMELEVGGQTGAAHGEKSPERQARRDGDRDRGWQTRAGNVDLPIPKLRTGRCVPSFPEPRRAAGKALTAVIREACVHGVPTRAMDDPVQAMGGTGISESRVGRLREEIDERVDAVLTRPIDSEWHAPSGSNRWRHDGVSLDRRHMPEGPPGRSHRQCCRHDRGRREHGRQTRRAGHEHRAIRSVRLRLTLPDGPPA